MNDLNNIERAIKIKDTLVSIRRNIDNLENAKDSEKRKGIVIRSSPHTYREDVFIDCHFIEKYNGNQALEDFYETLIVSLKEEEEKLIEEVKDL